MKRDGQVYHSSKYMCKRKSVSLLVQFQEGELTCYGKVEYFVKNGDGTYAVVNLFKNLRFNVSQSGVPWPEDIVLKEFWSADYLGCHFITVQKMQQYKYIPCSNIVCYIVLVESEDELMDGYVPTVVKNYQCD